MDIAQTGTASVAKGASDYIDSLTNNTIGGALRSAMPIDISFLGKYPDFFAFMIVMIVTLLLSIGVRLSSTFINVFLTVNLTTVLIIVGSGILKGNYYAG